MRAFLYLLAVAVLTASAPALAKSHYSKAHTQKLVRMRQYPKHGKSAAPHPTSRARRH